MHNNWLLPGYFHGNAMDQTDEMLLFYNPCDRVLKRYHFLDRRSKPRALGFTGLPTCCDNLAISDRIIEVNANPHVGRSHGELSYFQCPALMETARQVLLWDQVD